MGSEWEPKGDEEPGSLQSFGRQLRAQLGGVFLGLDDTMIGLLVTLLGIPGVTADANSQTESE